MHKKKKGSFRSLVSLLLVLTFLISYVSAATTPDFFSHISLSTITQFDQTSGTQSDSIAEMEASTRSIDELKSLGAAQFSTDGQVTSVKVDAEIPMTNEEIVNLLLSNTNISDKARSSSPQTVDDMAVDNIEEQFGLTKSDIERGEYLHGSLSILNSELGSFLIAKRYSSIPVDLEDDILHLISYGYTASQAISAVIAAPLLNVTIEEISSTKQAEVITAIQREEEKMLDEGETQIENEYAELSTRLGIPLSIVENFMDTHSDSEQALINEYKQAMNAAYHTPVTSSESIASLAAKEVHPEGLLRKCSLRALT